MSGVKGELSTTTIPYDYLVMSVGAETQTFGIPGVQEHAVFMKEIQDAEKFQDRFIDCVESAAFPGQSDAEVDRLLHAVVVGGGPTGIELSGELHDFLEEDLKMWYPELAGKIRISLIEALPSVLPMFSKELIAYTLDNFKEAKIDVLTKTMVKEIKPNSVLVKRPDGTDEEIPCGLVVWAGGNKPRKIAGDLMKMFPEQQTNRRGIAIDDHMRVLGTEGIYAIGDCTASSYAPTAQVASQEGAYLARVLAQVAKADALRDKRDALRAAGRPLVEIDAVQRQLEKADRIRPFHYSHQGSLAYIGSDKAIADLSFWQRPFSSSGGWTYLFWRSAYLSTLFSLRNRSLVAMDWAKTKMFGR
jgi:NADH:ubiquinone reductase (non-electrogenic)